MIDFDLQQQLIDARRKQYGAKKDFQAPQGRMVGNTYVAANPLEYLAAGLRSYSGIRGEQMAGDELKQLQGDRQKAITDALRGFTEQAKGVPAEVLPPDMAGPARPAQAPDMSAAYASLLQAPDAGVRQAGMQGIVQMPQLEAKNQELELARNFKTQQMQAEHELKMQMMREQNSSRQQMQEEQRGFQREMAQLRAQSVGASAQPYFQPVQTAQGVMAFNARTGRVEPVMGNNGQAIIGAAADPTLQGALAGAKSGATVEAKARTEARLEAPQAIAQADEAVRLVDDLLKAPGLKQAVGASRVLGVQKIPGTDAKDFDIRLEQLKGKQFLQAFESLKGGGAITEMEGKKATDAIARMDAAGSEPEFIKAAKEFQSIIIKGAERARAKGGAPAAASATTPKPRLKFDNQGNLIP